MIAPSPPKGARNCVVLILDSCRWDAMMEADPTFIKRLGNIEKRYSYATWTAPGAPIRDVDPTSAAYARKIAVWKKLPLWLANRLGPLIARDLA